MQYAAHLPSRQQLFVPVVSLAIGAAGAVGIYSVLDETDVTVEPTRVVVQQAPPATAHDEASTAAAISGSIRSDTSGKDESLTAASIGGTVDPGFKPVEKNESATAAAVSATVNRGYLFGGKDEAATAAAVGGSSSPEVSASSERRRISALTGPRLRTP